MTKPAFAALLCIGLSAATAPALAQDTQASPQASEAPQGSETAAPAGQLTPEQIAAFNQSVTDFTEAQKLQQSGDNAGAAAKYDAALPAIRAAVAAQPENKDYAGFLANTLYAAAAAQAGLRNAEGALSLYEEATPLWRDMVAANPADAASRKILAGMLVQLGIKALSTQDKSGADVYYREATGLARKAITAAPQDPAAKNLLLSALIGLSQTANDKAITDEVVAMGKKMMAEGSIDAINRPSIEIMTGVKS